MHLPDIARSPGRLTVMICGGCCYTDEYILFDYLDRLLQQCEDHGLQLVVVQGGADGADAIAREWVLHKKAIGIDIELITDPNYSSPVASEPRSIYWGFKNPRSADAGLRRRLGASLAPIKHRRRNASLEPGRVPAVRLCSALRPPPFGRRRLEGASKPRRSRAIVR